MSHHGEQIVEHAAEEEENAGGNQRDHLLLRHEQTVQNV